ncbi:MAG: hypothetical protein NTZ72_19370 [Afipia sp.]|nr:hypothetical protein [Afipia sp.]
MNDGFAESSFALRRLVWTAVFAMAMVATGASAQNYPNRPIRIIVPYAAGGAIDATARILAEPLSALLGQPLIIENKPGAAHSLHGWRRSHLVARQV